MACGSTVDAMPLTPLQRRVLEIIAANRSEESHFAGGVLLNAPDDSPRFSHGFDIFRSAAEEVARASAEDMAALRAAGYKVEPVSGEWSEPSTFRKAQLT